MLLKPLSLCLFRSVYHSVEVNAAPFSAFCSVSSSPFTTLAVPFSEQARTEVEGQKDAFNNSIDDFCRSEGPHPLAWGTVSNPLCRSAGGRLAIQCFLRAPRLNVPSVESLLAPFLMLNCSFCFCP